MTNGTTRGPEVIVVGGGIIGLSVANALLGRGIRVTSVFPPESDTRPSASRAAGAMLGAFGEVTDQCKSAEDRDFRFRLEAQRRYPDWLGEHIERAGAPIHQALGTFVVANNVGINDRSNLHLMKQLADDVGEPAEYIDPSDVPGLLPSQYQAPGLCLHLAREHSVDPVQLLEVMTAAASTFDTWKLMPAVVDAVHADGSGWAVTTKEGTVARAGHVVVCAGSRSWEVLSPGLRKEAGLPDMYFGKGVSCTVRGGPPVPSTIRTPNRAFACGIHVVPRADGRLYLGATNNLGIDHDVERGIQPGELHSLFDDIIHQISTELRESRIEAMAVGFRPITSHGDPVVGATQLQGLSVATGTYRDGVLMAPVIADIVTGEISGLNGVVNPFPVTAVARDNRADNLVDVGVRDIVSFLQEPRGELPYDRAEQLRTYVTALFRMAVDDDSQHAALREDIRRRLSEVPLNETMHRIFRDIVDSKDVPGQWPPDVP